MSNLIFTVQPPSSNNIRRAILREVARIVNGKIPKIEQELRRFVKEEMAAALKDSSEYAAMVNGPLDAHFGFEAGSAATRLESIIDTVVRAVKIDVEKVSILGSGLRGGVSVSLSTDIFPALFSMSEANVENLPWLEWLLTRGNDVIISGYSILFKNTPYSRSGYAIMVKSQKGIWRVPAQYAGTTNDNWITRTMDMFESQLKIATSNIIRREF